MAANENKLGELHNAVAQVLIEAVTPKEVEGYLDEDTGEVVGGGTLLPSPAMLQAAIKFLKDNNVTCEPAADNAMGELEAIIAKRRQALLDKTDRAALSEDMRFMGNA